MCLAIPGKVLNITGDDPLQRVGRVSFGGILKEVSLACVPEAKVGDYVVVHVGLAISTVDAEEAERVFGYLREIGDLAELDASAEIQPNPEQASSGHPAEVRGESK